MSIAVVKGSRADYGAYLDYLPHLPRYLTTREVMALANCKYGIVRYLIERDIIRAYNFGGLLAIPESELPKVRAWINRKNNEARCCKICNS